MASGTRAPMALLGPSQRQGFGVCFLIGLCQAKDRAGRLSWPEEQYLALGLCRPSPWLVDLIFPEVCGLSQNGSASYLRHTLDTILGRKGLFEARLVESIFPEVRWLSQKWLCVIPASYL